MTICYLFAFGLSLSLIVLWAYVFFPFQLPQVGFWENWIFNFVAHPRVISTVEFLIARYASLPGLALVTTPYL